RRRSGVRHHRRHRQGALGDERRRRRGRSSLGAVTRTTLTLSWSKGELRARGSTGSPRANVRAPLMHLVVSLFVLAVASASAAEHTLGSRELQQLRGMLTNDPLRAVQALPAVAAGDDFRSEFAIRGAGVSHMNFIFEGIATPFLLHTVQQVHDSGSIAMVNGD